MFHNRGNGSAPQAGVLFPRRGGFIEPSLVKASLKDMGGPPQVAVYPGTFDPITNGHIDILKRAAPLFEKVIVTLAMNSGKEPLFSVEERLEMIRRSVESIPNVEVASFSGLVVDFAHQVGASVLIRGLRAVSDFEYEFQMALMNRKQRPNIDTVYMMPDERYTYLSSSIVREVAKHGGNVNCFVPPFVDEMLKARYTGKSGVGK